MRNRGSKPRGAVAVFAAMLLACVAGAAPAMAQSDFLIRYAGIQGPDDAATKAMFHFKDEVERESKGRVKVQVYYQTQLAGGNTIDQMRFLKIGAIEMNNVGFAQMSQEQPDYGAMAMPFLFTDNNAANKALAENGKAWTILAADADKAGMRMLGFHFLGLRNLLTARKAVRSLADMKGMKLRVVQGQVPLATYRALGANPVPMDFAEVPAGMTQGVIDGTDLPVTSVVSVNAYSYGHYYTILRSYMEGQTVMMNKPFFNRLPPDLQAIVVTAVRNECAFELAQNAIDEKSAFDVLKSKGTEVINLPPSDLDAARTAEQVVYKDFGARFTPGLLDALQGKGS